MRERELVLEEFLPAVDRENPVVCAFDDEDGAVPVLLHVLLGGREFCGAVFPCGAACVTERTGTAFGIFDLAYGAAQFHQGFVVHVGLGRVRHFAGVAPVDFGRVLACGALVGRQEVERIKAREYPHQVSVENRFAFMVGEAQDGACGIGPDAGQSFQFLAGAGHSHPLNNNLRCLEDVPCAAVVAESLPVLEDFLFTCLGECGDVGKALHPFYEIVAHGRNLRLLQHGLADTHRVRVPQGVQVDRPPRQCCRVLLEPIA